MAVGSMSAQPTAVKNAAKGVFSLTTFRADGSLLDTSHGIYTFKIEVQSYRGQVSSLEGKWSWFPAGGVEDAPRA